MGGNPSNDHMTQLLNGAPQSQQSTQPQIDPQQLQQMFQALPKEVQQQIMQLPQEQQAQAIMQAFQQMQQQSQGAEVQQPQMQIGGYPSGSGGQHNGSGSLPSWLMPVGIGLGAAGLGFGLGKLFKGKKQDCPCATNSNLPAINDLGTNNPFSNFGSLFGSSNNQQSSLSFARNGGPVFKQGDVIQYRDGGKLKYGTVRHYNPLTEEITLM